MLNLIILLAAAWPASSATLTLPGIAGIVLTIGMAVDTNILIFERIREELRGGQDACAAAIEAGFARALRDHHRHPRDRHGDRRPSCTSSAPVR